MVIDVPAKAYVHRKNPKGEESLVRREKLYVINVDRLSMRASALKHIHNLPTNLMNHFNPSPVVCSIASAPFQRLKDEHQCKLEIIVLDGKHDGRVATLLPVSQ
jgi:hypothetical protein